MAAHLHRHRRWITLGRCFGTYSACASAESSPGYCPHVTRLPVCRAVDCRLSAVDHALRAAMPDARSGRTALGPGPPLIMSFIDRFPDSYCLCQRVGEGIRSPGCHQERRAGRCSFKALMVRLVVGSDGDEEDVGEGPGMPSARAMGTYRRWPGRTGCRRLRRDRDWRSWC
jgi:hypothetical protein